MKKKIMLISLVLMFLIAGVSVKAVTELTDNLGLYTGTVNTDESSFPTDYHPYSPGWERHIMFEYGLPLLSADFNSMYGSGSRVFGAPCSFFGLGSSGDSGCYGTMFGGSTPVSTNPMIIMRTLPNGAIVKKRIALINHTGPNTGSLYQTVFNKTVPFVDYFNVPRTWSGQVNAVVFDIYYPFTSYSENAAPEIDFPTVDAGIACIALKEQKTLQDEAKLASVGNHTDSLFEYTNNILLVNVRLLSILLQVFKIVVFIIALGALAYLLLFIVLLIKGGRNE